ncbi:alpha:beta hydrolase fold protein [Trichuris trichiura]|uniref:Alpha:beta hydrolase fold protein n=1 Tax=Trichuris trichiura TaxID=36087 RepID=A0A077YZA0_TRITR|nr:alpha:beta hydrolase fold protein [Trichuris trichiura]
MDERSLSDELSCELSEPADEEEEEDLILSQWNQSLPITQISLPKLTRLRQLLSLRHISDATMVKFNVRALASADGLIFPRYSDRLERVAEKQLRPSGLKICKLSDSRINIANILEKNVPDGNVVGFFGYHLTKSSVMEVALSMNEADAMAIFQASGKAALVIPDQLHLMHPKLVFTLREFSRLTFWPPPDKFAKAKAITKNLNIDNCHLVSPRECKNLRAAEAIALPAARGRQMITNIINASEPEADKRVESLAQLKEQAKGYFYSQGSIGGIAKWKRFGVLNSYLKGFRLGELTLIGGSNGSGKKSFATEYALDLCLQQVRTLWCCLETPVGRIASMMVEQFSKYARGNEFVFRIPFIDRETFYESSSSQRSFDYWYDEMGNLPMQFVSFNTAKRTRLKELLETIEQQSVQHAIIDNLLAVQEANYAKNVQEIKRCFADIRRFAVTRNVHITGIADEMVIQTDSALGRVVQGLAEADNVLFLNLNPEAPETEKSLKSPTFPPLKTSKKMWRSRGCLFFLISTVGIAILIHHLHIPLPAEMSDRWRMHIFEICARVVYFYPVSFCICKKNVRRWQVVWTRLTVHSFCRFLSWIHRLKERHTLKVEDVVLGGVPCRVYIPESPDTGAAIVFIHGGGFVLLNVASYDLITRLLAKVTNMVTISVEYRLAPEHRFPSAVDDCENVIMHLLSEGYKKYHVNTSKITLIGDSAGGNLAAAVTQRMRNKGVKPTVKLQVLIYPLLQFSDFLTPSYQLAHRLLGGTSLPDPESIVRWSLLYFGIDPTYTQKVLKNMHVTEPLRSLFKRHQSHGILPSSYRDPSFYNASEAKVLPQDIDYTLARMMRRFLLDWQASPLMQPDMSGLPPALIVTTQFDPLRDDGYWYAVKLRNAGVNVTHMHYERGFHAMLNLHTEMTIGRKAIHDIGTFIRSCMA